LEKPAVYTRSGSAETWGTATDPVAEHVVVISVSRRSTNSTSSVGKPVLDAP
jgi:hypothetical protein